jgi:hypothetical protein
MVSCSLTDSSCCSSLQSICACAYYKGRSWRHSCGERLFGNTLLQQLPTWELDSNSETIVTQRVAYDQLNLQHGDVDEELNLQSLLWRDEE